MSLNNDDNVDKEKRLYLQVRKAQKKYYDKNKIKLVKYAHEWNINNKDTYNKNANKYYQENKHILKQQKYVCACGANVQTLGKHMHLKTKKHIKFINDFENKMNNIIIFETVKL
jgi:hypothetical protein